MLILNWGSYQDASWGNASWACQFVNEVYHLTGAWPLIYIQESAIWQVASCVSDCGLWVAKYASMGWSSWTVPSTNVSSGAFEFITGWQYIGGGIGRSIFYLDAASWDKLTNSAGATAPEIEASKPNSIPTPVNPAPSASNWVDALGDHWFEENGTFISSCALHLRWGATINSSVVAITSADTVTKYDAYSCHGGHVWLRQPRGHGQCGYIACHDADTNGAFGIFKWLK